MRLKEERETVTVREVAEDKWIVELSDPARHESFSTVAEAYNWIMARADKKMEGESGHAILSTSIEWKTVSAKGIEAVQELEG